MLGQIANMMPGMGEPETETIYVDGGRMRVDADGQSTITDLETGTMASVDHEGRSYFTLDIGGLGESFREVTEAATEGVQDAMRDADAELQERAAAQEAQLDIRVSTDVTGNRQEVAGIPARQAFLTLEMDVADGFGQMAGGGDQPAMGGMVMLVELWLAESFPGDDALAAAAARLAGSASGESFQSGLAGLEAIFAQNPEIGIAFERSQEELQALEGTAVRTTTHMVLVPEGMAFDREAALADADRSLGDELQDAATESAADAARNAAENAAREAAGRFGGLFGGGDDEEEEEEEPEEEEPRQQVMMRIVSEVRDVEEGPLPDGIFDLPEDYSLSESPFGQLEREGGNRPGGGGM